MQNIPQAINDCLSTLNQTSMPKALVIGLSGGVDSVVLLHALTQLSSRTEPTLPQIHAVYINHGLSPNAHDWQKFCLSLGKSFGINCEAIKVSVKAGPRESLEAQARTARYDALLAYAKQWQGALLTAHHLDDQLETVMLQLKRGAGPKGLSGMAPQSEMRGVMLLRPLLSVSKQDIRDYAESYALKWIEDESNLDEQFDRNFLRQTVLPLLSERWPSLAQTVGRSARLCAEQQALLDEVCDSHLANLTPQPNKMDILRLQSFETPWQQAIVRRWLAVQSVLMPSEKQLQQILAAVNANADRQPEIKLGERVIRRFRQYLYCLAEQEPVTIHAELCVDSEMVVDELDISLKWTANPVAGGVAITVPVVASLIVETPVLSTKIKPQGESHSKPIKQWLKAWDVPPWERQRLLLLTVDDKAVAMLLNQRLITLEQSGTESMYLTVRFK